MSTKNNNEQFSKGLAGVVAGETAICTVGQAGMGLNYRGYSIQDLAEKACFEEVAYLLIYGRLPTTQELSAYIEKLSRYRNLPEAVKRVLELIPANAHPMDVHRTACSLLGNLEPESATPTDPKDPYSQYNIADRLIALFGPIILYWYHFHNSGGIRIETYTKPCDTIAKNFVKLLRNDPAEPDELVVRAIDVSLILYAEHEFAASTFAARITASTLSDIYSAITSAIGTLRGPLHGGANEAAWKLISKFTTPDNAEQGVLEMLKAKQLIMGFGHRVYRKGDPRSPIIKSWAQKLNSQRQLKSGEPDYFAIAERIESVINNIDK
eukprot:GEZU01007924.1.p1 GENE.GEZU01007924.1~~GEZU01007924.1.p1  ORF type:complete len:357 (-),score=72.69 GEZU01007924.1:55-1026(-)